MPVVTQIIGSNVSVIFEGTYNLCQLERSKKRKDFPRLKFEVRSSREAVKSKPILKC